METWYYDVVRIEGDYAYLKRTDKEIDDEKMVARALLPPEIMIGSHLKYEMMQYEMNWRAGLRMGAIESNRHLPLADRSGHGFVRLQPFDCI